MPASERWESIRTTCSTYSPKWTDAPGVMVTPYRVATDHQARTVGWMNTMPIGRLRTHLDRLEVIPEREEVVTFGFYIKSYSFSGIGISSL